MEHLRRYCCAGDDTGPGGGLAAWMDCQTDATRREAGVLGRVGGISPRAL